MKKLLFFLFLFLSITHVFSQEINLKGNVISNSDNLPIPGVNIIIAGTTEGTITDLNGNFDLQVNKDARIKVSSIGFKEQIIEVNGRQTINIVLEESTESINEVVVIGYGTQKKEDLTTSLVSIDSKEIGKVSSPTFTHSLQGKASGVIVNSESGQPGGSTSIRVRGYGALNYNEPLYVIDGVILNTYSEESDNPTKIGSTPANSILASLNPSDIESINILKDASATAIYGSRAGNGVVLITTKKGKKGEAKIAFNSYLGVQQVGQKINLMNGEEFAEFSTEGRLAAQMVPYAGYSNPDTLLNTDWQEELFKVAPIQNYQLSVSGGNEKGNYYISFGYIDQKGVLPKSYFKRYSIRVNLSQRIGNRINLGNSFTISQSQSNALPNGNLHSGVILGALRMPPYIPVSYNQNGYTKYYGVGDYEALFAGRTSNPVHSAMMSNNLSIVKKMLGNLFVETEIIKHLKFKANLGLDYTFSNARSFDKTYIDFPYLNPNEKPISFREIPIAASRDYNEANIALDLTLTYERSIKNNNLTAMIGHTAQVFKMDNSYTTSTGHLTNNLTTTQAGDPTTQVGSNGLSELSYESYIARALYNYNRKYYLSYSFRRDGSSRFGSGLKFASFHSISGAWRISGEKFMQPLADIIYDLKFRGSWGQTGIDGSLPPVEFPKLEGHYSYVFNGDQIQTGYAPVGVPNPKLRWETAQQIDVGLDLLLIDGRINFIADYFQKTQFDIITQKPIPFLLGITHEEYTPTFPVETVNGPEVINKGIELSLDYYSKPGDFTYKIGVNYSTFDNEITKLENDIISESYNGYNIILNRQGSPINQFYGFKTDGIFRDEDDRHFEKQPGASLGDVKYVDINDDGVVDDNDRTIIGSPIPNFTFGFNASAQYKGFDFSMALQGVYGNEIYNANMGWILNSKDGSNRHAVMNDRWSEENPDGNYPRAIATDPNNNARASDLFIEDGSYIRLQNIELGYSLKKDFLVKIRCSNLRFYISSQNLITLTQYTGYSPEVGVMGIDASVYPVARKFLVGVNLSF